jgi:hypothetical protein
MAEIGRRENVSQATVARILAANGFELIVEIHKHRTRNSGSWLTAPSH